mgnify:CR=1 FL=1
MTSKLKNRLQKMTFQKQIKRRVEVVNDEETKYYEQLYKEQTMELLGIKHENNAPALTLKKLENILYLKNNSVKKIIQHQLKNSSQYNNR